MNKSFTGLTSKEVEQKKSLGLSNDTIDSFTPSVFEIYRRNIFSLINLILIPLLITLGIYEQYKEIFAFSTFLIINTAVSIIDELRIKNQLDKLKSQFQRKAIVIRDGKEEEIPADQIVEGDLIKGKEGDGILADGEILYENYLQLDESVLNGESNYIRKDLGEKVLSGSFIVTGDCVYKVLSVGKDNYLNKLGAEAVKYKEKKSELQKNGDKLILMLVVISILLSVFNFYTTGMSGASNTDRVLSLTTIIALVIPQTLIFLFTLTFTISITKLYNKGVLVQKGASIEELANIDTICFDKTGTITTNDMKLVNVKYFNLDENEIGSFYNSVKNRIVGVNKTQELLHKYYNNLVSSLRSPVSNFDQVPFTSKNKFSLVTGTIGGKDTTLVFGAFSKLKENIKKELQDEIEQYVTQQESEGNRVLIGIHFEERIIQLQPKADSPMAETSKQIAIYTIEEELNPGIKGVLRDLYAQGINVKIISGDSLLSVTRVLQKVGLNTEKIVDLSTIELQADSLPAPLVNMISLRQAGYQLLAEKYDIFTRSKPEDKLELIKALQQKGHKVAMVGDGINDVLSIKAADVSIAMESGSKIARDVSDIVLLKNDYKKIPQIFFEGENIIFNLKMSTKIFLLKSFLATWIALYFSFNFMKMPFNPASTLIFSFLGSSAPSYILIFTRQKVEKRLGFFKEVLLSSIPASLIFGAVSIYFYLVLKSFNLEFLTINTALVLLVLSANFAYSLFLIWESRKLKNLFYLAFSYILVMLVGTYQTILPLFNIKVNGTIDFIPTQPTDVSLIMLFLMLIGSLLIYTLLTKVIKPRKTHIKIFLLILSLIYIPIVSIFPFQTYYSVKNISADLYIHIFTYTIISILGILVIHALIHLFNAKSKKKNTRLP